MRPRQWQRSELEGRTGSHLLRSGEEEDVEPQGGEVQVVVVAPELLLLEVAVVAVADCKR